MEVYQVLFVQAKLSKFKYCNYDNQKCISDNSNIESSSYTATQKAMFLIVLHFTKIRILDLDQF